MQEKPKKTTAGAPVTVRMNVCHLATLISWCTCHGLAPRSYSNAAAIGLKTLIDQIERREPALAFTHAASAVDYLSDFGLRLTSGSRQSLIDALEDTEDPAKIDERTMAILEAAAKSEIAAREKHAREVAARRRTQEILGQSPEDILQAQADALNQLTKSENTQLGGKSKN